MTLITDTAITYYTLKPIRYFYNNYMVTVSINGLQNITPKTYIEILTLPDGCRPSIEKTFYTKNPSGGAEVRFIIDKLGKVKVYAYDEGLVGNIVDEFTYLK